jgi:hypothetical protein
MLSTAKSIRPFIGCHNFTISRSFYATLGFTETILAPELSVFKAGNFNFYLQNAYIKDWVDNTQVFMEVENIEGFWNYLQQLNLPQAFENVRLSSVKNFTWGSEFYLHDPSGILWHFGQFS